MIAVADIMTGTRGRLTAHAPLTNSTRVGGRARMADHKSSKVTGSTKDYHFGPKNHWRRTIWNELLSRTAGHEKTAPILYLSGPQDMDRQIAIEKGVPPDNLIAIDKDRDNVEAVRAAKASAIHGDAVDVLWSWPKGQPVSAVLLDFCSGLTWAQTGVFDVFQRQPFRNAVVVVNFLRGRDGWSNGLRETLQDCGLLNPMWRFDARSGDIECIHEDTKHRAYQFLMFHSFDTLMAIMGLGSTKVDSTGRGEYVYPEPDEKGNPEPEFAMSVCKLYLGLRPRLFSYKSGALRMDSAVFEPTSRGRDALVPPFLLAAGMAEISKLEAEYSERPLVRQIAAVMAVRTQRLRQ